MILLWINNSNIYDDENTQGGSQITLVAGSIGTLTFLFTMICIVSALIYALLR